MDIFRKLFLKPVPSNDDALTQVLVRDSGGEIKYRNASSLASGGLTNFTDTQNATAPNVTVPVSVLTAVSATTNADIAVIPKGTGAFMAQIPDSTMTGGNKRGDYAVDMQRTRINSPSEVASGYGSVISGGNGNKASALYSAVIGGFLNYATGQYSIAGGSGNLASSSYSIALGANNTVSSYASIGVGNYNNVSADYSSAFGDRNTISAQYGSAFGGQNSITNGLFASVFGYKASNSGMKCKVAFGSSVYGVGATQSAIATLDRRTTDATPSVLFIDSGTSTLVSLANQFYLPNNSLMRIKGSIQGKQSGSVNCAVWDFDAVLVRGVGVGTFAIVGVPTITLVTNTPSWGTPALTANTADGCLTATVTGAVATNIQWAMNINSVETIYA